MSNIFLDDGEEVVLPQDDSVLAATGYYLTVRLDLPDNFLITRDKHGNISYRGESRLLIRTDADFKNAMYMQTTGTVVSVGPKCWVGGEFDGEPWAKVGDRIMFGRHEGQPAIWNHYAYMSIPDKAVRMVLPLKEKLKYEKYGV